MINQPESNIKLESEQENQLAYVKKSLDIMQSEVLVAIKTLTDTRLECEKIKNEKAYQEELLGVLDKKVVDATNKLSLLESESNRIAQVLSDNTKKTETVGKENTAIAETLKLRDQQLSKKELEFDKKSIDLRAENAILVEKRLEVEKAQKAFSEALKTVTWK